MFQSKIYVLSLLRFIPIVLSFLFFFLISNLLMQNSFSGIQLFKLIVVVLDLWSSFVLVSFRSPARFNFLKFFLTNKTSHVGIESLLIMRLSLSECTAYIQNIIYNIKLFHIISLGITFFIKYWRFLSILALVRPFILDILETNSNLDFDAFNIL